MGRDDCVVGVVAEMTEMPVYTTMVQAALMTRAGEIIESNEPCVLPRESPGIDAQIQNTDDDYAKGIFFQTGKFTQDGRAIFRQGWVN